MGQLYMLINIDRCWGCKSCTVACKQNRGLPPGELSPISIARIETQGEEGAACDFIPVACQHCADPACLAVCPMQAIFVDEEGLVRIRPERCIGCGKCAGACPYGAISIRKKEKGREAYKCDLCVQRRADGGKTACEQHCPGGVFRCTGEEEAEAFRKTMKYTYSVGHVIYGSNILSELGVQPN